MQPVENRRIDKQGDRLGGGEQRRSVAELCMGNPKALPNSRSKLENGGSRT
jgi:hypothetical protein